MDEIAKILINFRKELYEQEERIDKIGEKNKSCELYELYGKTSTFRYIIQEIEEWFCKAHRMEFIKYKDKISTIMEEHNGYTKKTTNIRKGS